MEGAWCPRALRWPRPAEAAVPGGQRWFVPPHIRALCTWALTPLLVGNAVSLRLLFAEAGGLRAPTAWPPSGCSCPQDRSCTRHLSGSPSGCHQLGRRPGRAGPPCRRPPSVPRELSWGLHTLSKSRSWGLTHSGRLPQGVPAVAGARWRQEGPSLLSALRHGQHTGRPPLPQPRTGSVCPLKSSACPPLRV